MIHNYYRLLVVGTISSLLYTANAMAYRFTFHNKTDHEVRVVVGVIWAVKEVEIPSGKSTTIGFDGIEAGLCISHLSIIQTRTPGGRFYHRLWENPNDLRMLGCGDIEYTITQTTQTENSYIVTRG